MRSSYLRFSLCLYVTSAIRGDGGEEKKKHTENKTSSTPRNIKTLMCVYNNYTAFAYAEKHVYARLYRLDGELIIFATKHYFSNAITRYNVRDAYIIRFIRRSNYGCERLIVENRFYANIFLHVAEN